LSEPFELSAAQAAAAIRDGRLTAAALMESLLARSAALEPSLRVWVTLDEAAAMAGARRADDELRRGEPAGPLHGVPVGVKDIYNTSDMKTTSGSPMYVDFQPDFDSTAVALLRRGGAIVMGKTVTTEFACADPSPTRNPWNAAHTPGGSSSGSAAGVAARMFPVALGSQTAGSVVRPASYNGVVGMKPTFGLVSRYGVTPVSWSLDTMGFFCRTVEDAALVLSCLAEHDPNDSASVPTSARAPSEPAEGEPAPPRIGTMRRFFYDKAEPEVRSATDEAIGKLSAAGAAVEDISVETGYDDLLAAHRMVMAVEAAAVHERRFAARADEYGPRVRGLIESGMLAPAVTYVQAQRVREKFRREMARAVEGFDAVLGPTTPAAAPRDLTTTGNPVFQVPWTSCGFPAITLPCGLSESGLPLGVQLAAGPLRESRLLSAAGWCERALGFEATPPLP
jgi:aspartyl-tRNA(Asn)/glutamyl-tRNA(Gln) amidotransferase subunit A